MTGNRSYRKGAKFERAIRDVLASIGSTCLRTFMSGAYTGDADLKWDHKGRIYECSCKIKADGFKFDYAELEKADMLFKRSDRNIALVTMTLPIFLELIGEGE